MHAADAYLVAFLEAGGRGYIAKAAADRDVVQAIQTLLEGKIFIGKDGLDALVQKHSREGGTGPLPGPGVLSPRERLVLELTARGFTSREIAEQLVLSPHTVDTYRSRIMEKLGLEHRHQLVEYALRHRLLDTDSGTGQR
jgi:two-component system response regulator NreC